MRAGCSDDVAVGLECRRLVTLGDQRRRKLRPVTPHAYRSCVRVDDGGRDAWQRRRLAAALASHVCTGCYCIRRVARRPRSPRECPGCGSIGGWPVLGWDVDTRRSESKLLGVSGVDASSWMCAWTLHPTEQGSGLSVCRSVRTTMGQTGDRQRTELQVSSSEPTRAGWAQGVPQGLPRSGD